MSRVIATDVTPVSQRRSWLASLGQWMRGHRRAIQGIQWAVVLFYAVLIILPAVQPLPPHTAHIWDDITLFAQFLFWGIWWPFVLLSMVVMGRTWCGVFCPEGTLSEWASRHGRGGAIPRWVRWGGWPFVAFVGTTVYGQMLSVYQYPQATLLILGGSTVGALIIGYLYGRNVRVWCRYLCPVNGVFGLLAKLAPVHFRADPQQWQASRERGDRPEAVNCPTLLNLRDLQSASSCHACGRCEGHRDAIALTPRAPNSEILEESGHRASAAELVLITFGLGGIAVGAFHWSASPWFITLKQWLATWLVEHDWFWPLQTHTPWWVFTNYPGQNDVFNLLDGTLLLAYIGVTGLVMGTLLTLLLQGARRALGPQPRQTLYHLSHGLIPVVACGVFLGLSALTVSMLRAEQVPLFWVTPLRAMLLGGAGLWSLWLLWRIGGQYSAQPGRRMLAFAMSGGAVALVVFAWWLLFWGW
ncbi:4Fe-4S binding protein [Marinobacteraceae bacterium S3BR75-40.1]